MLFSVVAKVALQLPIVVVLRSLSLLCTDTATCRQPTKWVQWSQHQVTKENLFVHDISGFTTVSAVSATEETAPNPYGARLALGCIRCTYATFNQNLTDATYQIAACSCRFRLSEGLIDTAAETR